MNGSSILVLPIDYVLIAAVLLCLLPAVLVVGVMRRQLLQRRADRKHPFAELKRRPAGEGLRLKIEVLDEKLDDRIMLFLAGPTVLAITVFVLRIHNLWACVTLLTISLIWTLSFRGGLSRLLEERRTHQLGFDGERYVGEELSRLIASGFEIYHDVPFEGYNIDHALVGRRGVFIVETKTRSKPVNQAGEKEYQVVFDGKCLLWPWGAETRDMQQAIDAAGSFSKYLSGAVGEHVQALPILTLPGWWIEAKGFSKAIYVVNPKQINQLCASEPEQLDDHLIKRICHQLDQKCRIEIG